LKREQQPSSISKEDGDIEDSLTRLEKNERGLEEAGSNRGYLSSMTTNQVCNFVADMFYFSEGPPKYPRKTLHGNKDGC
jgi:hypothetical protein